MSMASDQEACRRSQHLLPAFAGLGQAGRSSEVDANSGMLQAEAKLPVDPDEFQEAFKPFLMDVTYQWSKVCASSTCM